MESVDIVLFVVLIVLLMLSAFFSATETAMMTVNKLRISVMAEEGKKRAIVLQKVLSNQEKMLSAILIGNNLVNISSSSIATILATKLLGSAGAGVATGVLTFLILIFGEITPKNMANLYSEKMALATCKIIWCMMIVLTPIIVVINFLSHLVFIVLKLGNAEQAPAYTEGELRSIVDVSTKEGIIEKDENFMINNVFDFGDAKAKDIMVPRIDMVFVESEMSYEDVMEIFRKTMFTRFPVYSKNMDNVVGILNMKDILLHDRKRKFRINDYIREAYFTFETKDVSDLLLEMKASSNPVAIVVDEYGATAGLITIEDLLEEIVGEIRDEYDQDEANDIQQLSDREYLIAANMNLDDINDALGTDFESEVYDSLGGLVIECIGDHLPREGEETTYHDLNLRVMKVKRNRIVQVYLLLPYEHKENETDSGE